MRRLRVSFALFWCVAAGLQAQELDRPLRAVHLSGNWGHTADAVERWEMDRTRRLVPLRYVEYLRSVQVDWVGFSVALHLEHSMDSTLERTYSGVRVQTFSDEAVRQIIREFRAHGFNVYMTLAIESFEQEHELDAVKHPAPRFQLGDPGYTDTGVPDDHLYCTCARQIDPDFWPWRPSHPDHDLFVAEFWESYAHQALHFASIAEEEGGRMYSLGTETDRLFRTRPGGDYWVNHFGTELQSMVDRVRAVYSGLLTYDMHYGAYWRDWFAPGSWRLWEDLDLDVIGVSAWFPLVDEPPTTVMDVDSRRREYERIFSDHLIPMAERNPGRPLVFLEYAAVDTVEPPAGSNRIYADDLFVDCDQRLYDFDPGQLQEETVIPSVCGLDVQWTHFTITPRDGLRCEGCGQYNLEDVPLMEGGIDQLGTHMFQCAPKLGRNPLGDAGFAPPFGVDRRVGARAARSLSWSAGSVRVRAGGHRRTCAPGPRSTAPAAPLGAPVAELTRRAARARRTLAASGAHVLTTRSRRSVASTACAHPLGANQIRVGVHANFWCASLNPAGGRSTRGRATGSRLPRSSA